MDVYRIIDHKAENVAWYGVLDTVNNMLYTLGGQLPKEFGDDMVIEYEDRDWEDCCPMYSDDDFVGQVPPHKNIWWSRAYDQNNTWVKLVNTPAGRNCTQCGAPATEYGIVCASPTCQDKLTGHIKASTNH